HPDLTPSGVEDADSSHPSEHNLHRESTAEGVAQLDRIARQMKSKERAANTLEGGGKKSIDEWQQLQAERKQGRTDHPEAFTDDGDGRYHAYWGVSANVPFGDRFWAACKYDNAIGGCSTTSATCADKRKLMGSCAVAGAVFLDFAFSSPVPDREGQVL
ncbi:561_t:CDS:2, partial [Acaulospora colombiana]